MKIKSFKQFVKESRETQTEGALGATAGALIGGALLGPLGAAVGGYLGHKKQQKDQGGAGDDSLGKAAAGYAMLKAGEKLGQGARYIKKKVQDYVKNRQNQSTPKQNDLE